MPLDKTTMCVSSKMTGETPELRSNRRKQREERKKKNKEKEVKVGAKEYLIKKLV